MSVPVELASVDKVFGRARVLRAVNLTIAASEAVALLGPNGAGKSTLVKLLATLSRPSAGTIRFAGRDADDETRRGIGVVAHESLCYGDLSGRENLLLFARLADVADPEAKAEALLARVGLAPEAAAAAARTYSRGMLQRLSVARAIIHSPSLILLDEPFTGLDRDGVALLQRLITEERARGATIVVVSHELDAIAPLVERVVVLSRGKVAHDGAWDRAQPASSLAKMYQDAVA